MKKYNILKGKNGIIFGVLNNKSIAWNVAKYCYLEGANIILSSNKKFVRIGNLSNLSKKINAKLITTNINSINDITNLYDISLKYFNSKIDFILHSVGYSYNIRKNIKYENTDYKKLYESWKLSAISFHKILKIAWKKKIMNKYGSIVTMSFIGSNKVFINYNDMGDHKSYLESITRNFGYLFGKKYKVRINTVFQSPTITSSSVKIKNFDKYIKKCNNISPLGNANAKECAYYIITLFSDLTKKITMQDLYNDGGFSKVSII